MKHPWKSLQGLPRPVWALFSATLVNRCGTMVLPFMVLYLTESRWRWRPTVSGRW